VVTARTPVPCSGPMDSMVAAVGASLARLEAALSQQGANLLNVTPGLTEEGTAALHRLESSLAQVKTHLVNFASSATTSLAHLMHAPAGVSAPWQTAAPVQVDTTGVAASCDLVNDFVNSPAATSEPLLEPSLQAQSVVSDDTTEPAVGGFAIGQHVRITGLVQRSDLNDASAVVIQPPDACGRIGVRVAASSLFGRKEEGILIKPANLRGDWFTAARRR
jgi:hypothetical protein